MRKSCSVLKLIAPAVFSLLFAPAFSQPIIGYQAVVSGLTQPVDIVNAGDGSNRLFIVQQNGIVRVWNGSSLLAGNFLNISSLIATGGSEQGLLSMAFHPDYNGTTNRYFFVYYTATDGAITLARYQTQSGDMNVADAASGVVLLSIPKPGTPYFTNHNGGKLLFGSDGMLYFGTGDGGDGGDPFNNAQNGASLLGKMLRIDVSGFASSAPFYGIPADNPYVSASDGIRDEIWATGLRNPWRWSFDRLNGDMWIADVGQGAWEEVNRVPAGTGGVNYGWRCREGMHNYNTSGCVSSYTEPVFEYPHSSATGGFSITGGVVYRGSAYPALYGYYVTADYISSNVWLVRPDGSFVRQGSMPNTISTFGEDENGELYAARRSNGTIYQVTVTGLLPVSLVSFSAEKKPGHQLLRWKTAGEWGTDGFQVEYSRDGQRFENAGWVAAARSSVGQSYSFQHNASFAGDVYYRLAMRDDDGSVRYSSVVRLSGKANGPRIYPTVIRNGVVNLELDGEAEKVQVVNGSGMMVFERSLGSLSGTTSISLPPVAKGFYFVRIIMKGNVFQEKVLVE
jgi:glucose/arabinose dehydrogenase